jgi:hypothetical protein
MNPIARMMKRYIKTTLKCALPLLLIGAIVLASTAGCVTNTTTKNESGGGQVTQVLTLLLILNS